MNPVDTLSQSAESSLPHRFESMASLFANRSALISRSRDMTYGQLNLAANRLATTIVARDLCPGDRVALLMNHDAPLIVGMLAILKAGMVVVTLNPRDPPSRLDDILHDAEVAAILTDVEHLDLANGLVSKDVPVVLFQEHPDAAPQNFDAPPISPDSMAFLIYTSGTTGHPKGVIQTHQNVLHNALRLSLGMQVTIDDRISLLAALSAAQGISTTWCALANGATLCPFPVKEYGLLELRGFIRERQVTILVSSASLFRAFIKTLSDGEHLPSVRLVRLGSEAATGDELTALNRHFPAGCQLLNSLSSSETGNIAQYLIDSGNEVLEQRLPVGFAAEGMEIALVDSEGFPVTGTAAGEIVVTSRYLSPGYWRNAELTAAKFRNTRDGSAKRTFLTGDLGRFDSQGRLHYVGRRDHQIKIRGFRLLQHAIDGSTYKTDLLK
jgi:amino acid adenylation domain-containing protein